MPVFTVSMNTESNASMVGSPSQHAVSILITACTVMERFDLWAVITFLCLYASSMGWFKVPCKGLSQPLRVEKKHAPYQGALRLQILPMLPPALSCLAQSSAAAFAQPLADREPGTTYICPPEQYLQQCGLPQLSVPKVQVDVASNTSPAALKIEEVQQRIMYPLGSFILPLAIRSAAALSCMNLSKPVLLLLLLL